MKPCFELLVDSAVIQEDVQRILADELEWSLFSGKTILVTGAYGMLAAYIVETLLNIGVHHSEIVSPRVIALVRNRQKAEKRFARYLESNSFKIVEQDVCETLNINEPVHIIVHAASMPRPDSEIPASVLVPNVQGTLRLLEYAQASSVSIEQVIFVSSSEVYGALPPETPALDEDTFYPLSPTLIRSCYAEGKRAGEALCVAFMKQYNVPVKIVRPFHCYGPGMDLTNDPRFFSSCVSDLVSGRDLIISGDGTARRCFCYMSDAVRAFFYVMTKGELGVAYNIGNDEMEFSVYDLACELIKNFKEKRLSVVVDRELSPAGYCPGNSSRIRPDLERMRALGWRPQVSVSDGFRKTVDCYRRVENVS